MIRRFLRTHAIEVAALFISILALSFTIFQGNEQIRHNRISVEPRLTSYFASDTKAERFGVYIGNNGMGTAYVKDLKVFVNNREVPDHNYGKFYSAGIQLQLNPLCFVFGGPRTNDSFPVGHLQYLIEAKTNPWPLEPKDCVGDRSKLEAATRRHELTYELEIESIYGEIFTYHFNTNTQKKKSN